MEITRGSLDEISRPASNHSNRRRPVSRVSLNCAASISYRRNVDAGSSLEILPPEDILSQEHDIEVEDFSSSESDVEDNISDSEDSTKQGISSNHQLALHLHDDDNESDTASSTPDVPNTIEHTTNFRGIDDSGPDAHLDPKIAEAVHKMRQLDRILAKKIKREKEVKRQRMELHRQLQRELEDAKPDGRDELREVSDNTIKFLALVPPSSHNEGIPLEDDVTPKSPVFATQPLDTEDGSHRNLGTDGNRSDKTGELSSGTSTHRSASSTTSNELFGKSKKVNKKKRRGQAGDKNGNKSNFIKRNIELANDAGNLIAMTDDEKKRLEDLLQDIEMLTDEDWTNNQSQLQLQIAPGMGYQPDADEQKMLKDIDARLEALMPAEDFMSIRSTPIQELTYGIGNISLEAFNLGEKVLQSNRQDRSQQEQLQRIEAELSQMQNAVEKEMKSPRISDKRLSEILRQCDDLSSRATSATSSYIQLSPHSSRLVVDALDNTEEIPHLPDDVLKYLLDEAQEAGITTNRSLSTTNEEEDEQGVTDLDNEPVTGRSTHVGALVSYDMIQELLRNPRATSVPSEASIPAINSPRSDSDETFSTGVGYKKKTPISSFLRSTSSLEVPLNDMLKRMSVTHNGCRQLQDSQRAPSDTNRASVSSQRSSHDEESVAIYTSTIFKSTTDVNQLPSLAAIQSISSHLDTQSDIRPPKTRDSSRIAFAESDAKTERKLLYSNCGVDSRQYTTIPTPPQISHTSPLHPQKSKLSNFPRFSKSKIKASSTEKSVPSPSLDASQDASQGADLRVTSVSACTSYSSIGRTDSQASDNTLVLSSDFEYENDEEVIRQMMRVPSKDGDEFKCDEAGVMASWVIDDAETPPSNQPLLSKPTLPVDSQKIHGIKTYTRSDSEDSQKPFSPVFF